MTQSPVNSPFEPAELYNQVTLESWRETAVKALKGEAFETLEKTSDDGIAIHPLYTAQDVGAPNALAPKTNNDGLWDIRQRVLVEAENEANKIALNELENGANSIDFEISDTKFDFAALSNGIFDDLASIGIIGHENGLEIAKNIIGQTPKEKLEKSLLSFNLDPLSLNLTGFDNYNLDDTLAFYGENIGKAPKAKFLCASADWMLGIDASRALQVAILIASGIEYLRAGESKGFSPSQINEALLFQIGIDGQVILEIAKLRAIRTLWAKVGAAIGENLPMDLQAIVSSQMLEDEHPHTNILRIANACFAAGTGGANIITTRSFEPDPEKESEFTRRIARNTQIILANESNIARANDPASGSFAFETLTSEIAKSAWGIVQEIEKAGGFSKAIKSGFIAKKLGE
ncbi:MAG: hypothetical protein J0L55_07850 [Caulobacterales bacterium]|nr:hypothetical protein [Caulobacterales bacterium]MCA0372487.1 methylmalonyl-CoA mutase family protein [Pseudomonadota bacterium]